MEIRILHYFLTIANEGSFSKAAKILNMTQPTLSRQIAILEDELKHKLFIRGKRNIELTEAGIYFKRRAEEISSLSEKAKDELIHFDSSIKGDIYIGAGESSSISKIIKICHTLQKEYPDIHFHFTSGDSLDLLDRLDNGLFDFCVVYGDVDQAKYNYIKLPYKETWSFLLDKEDPLSNKEFITPNDVNKLPLILSRQSINSEKVISWFNKKEGELNIVNTYSLVNNAIYMAKEKMGYLLTLKNIVDVNNTNLIYKKLNPELTISISIIRKKFKILSKPAEKLLNLIKDTI